MALLEKQLAVSSDMQHRIAFKGNNLPTWYDNYEVKNWYNAPTNDGIDTAFFYNEIGDEVYVQYGKNQAGWASARFFSQTLEIIDQENHENGDISATVNVQSNFFVGRKNDIAVAGFDVNYTAKINNIIIYEWSGNTYDGFDFGSEPPLEFTVRVPPEQRSDLTALTIEIEYPNGEFSDRELILGYGLYNPNPPSYIPMSIRKNTWESLNKNDGFINKRVNNNWLDFSTENFGTQLEKDKGKNRIRIKSDWLQLPPM